MRKKLLCGMLSLMITVFSTEAVETYASDMGNVLSVSENSISSESAEPAGQPEETIDITATSIISDAEGNVLSVDTDTLTGKINPLGFGYIDTIKKQREMYPDYYTFTTIDLGTWRFDQTFARGELFHEFQKARADEANWWYCTNDWGEPVVKEAITLTHPAYEYDYELESCAMQRCVELAYAYGHVRPNGIVAQEVFDDLGSLYLYGYTNEMNGAYGVTAEDIVALYMEDEDTADLYNSLYDTCYTDDKFMCYAGQGHRQIILMDQNFRIGIACIRCTDGTVLTEIFTANDKGFDGTTVFNIPLNSDPTPCVDGYKEMEIEIREGMVFVSPVLPNNAGYDIIQMKVGDSIKLGDIYMGAFKVPLDLTADNGMFNWGSRDTSILKVEDGLIKAVGEGTGDLDSCDGAGNGGVISITVDAAQTVPKTPTDPVAPPTDPETPVVPTAPTAPTTPTAPVAPAVTTHEQTISVKKKKVTYKKKSLKKKSKSFSIGAIVNDGGAHGRVTYKVTDYPKGGKKYISVSSKGKVKIKKGAKKGTYKVRVTVGATVYFNEASATVTIKVK